MAGSDLVYSKCHTPYALEGVTFQIHMKLSAVINSLIECMSSPLISALNFIASNKAIGPSALRMVHALHKHPPISYFLYSIAISFYYFLPHVLV